MLEETGSIIDTPKFAFHAEDPQKGNAFDFFIAHELDRQQPTGNEGIKYNTPLNQYEIVSYPLNQLNKINLVPSFLKDKIIDYVQKEIQK